MTQPNYRVNQTIESTKLYYPEAENTQFKVFGFWLMLLIDLPASVE
jgi:acyl-CoA hydrolase